MIAGDLLDITELVKHCVKISPTPTPGFVINSFLQISKCKIDSPEVNLSKQIVCVLKRHIVSKKRERREAYPAPNLATSPASIVTKTLVYDMSFYEVHVWTILMSNCNLPQSHETCLI